tara:strand:- start:373 stop:609 length:237 start_codon:yes stop_codon:yes gene_type:complete
MSSTKDNYVDHRDIIFNATQAYGAAVRETCKQYENIRGKVAGPDHYAHIRTVEAQEGAALDDLLFKINHAMNDMRGAG